jgi:hypothetical protein
MAELAPHWINFHAVGIEKALAWQSKWVKLLDPDPQLARELREKHERKTVGRLFMLDHGLPKASPKAAARWTIDLLKTHPANPHVDVWEVLNEPGNLLNEQDVSWLVAFYKALLQSIENEKMSVCIGNFGVGQPPGQGNVGAPWWRPWREVLEMLQNRHYLGLHEYWGPDGVFGCYPWWVGRFQFLHANVRIMITECGYNDAINRPGNKEHGWRGKLSEEQYLEQLMQYKQLCDSDPRIEACFVFTLDYASAEWQTFDTTELSERIGHMQTTKQPAPQQQEPLDKKQETREGKDIVKQIDNALEHLNATQELLLKLRDAVMKATFL